MLRYCDTCRFSWKVYGEETYCRRYPPTVFRDAGFTKTEFPKVSSNTTCGEWKAKDK